MPATNVASARLQRPDPPPIPPHIPLVSRAAAPDVAAPVAFVLPALVPLGDLGDHRLHQAGPTTVLVGETIRPPTSTAASLLEGEGHCIGFNLSITTTCNTARRRHERTWRGEGDDMIFIDGEPWPPNLHGTGSEDALHRAYGMQPQRVPGLTRIGGGGILRISAIA